MNADDAIYEIGMCTVPAIMFNGETDGTDPGTVLRAVARLTEDWMRLKDIEDAAQRFVSSVDL